MAIIKASSIIVTVLIGKLKTAPKQAHCMVFLFITLCKTPIMLMPIIIITVRFVINGLKSIRKAIPKANSVNA